MPIEYGILFLFALGMVFVVGFFSGSVYGARKAISGLIPKRDKKGRFTKRPLLQTRNAMDDPFPQTLVISDPTPPQPKHS